MAGKNDSNQVPTHINTAINRPYDRESHILIVDDDQTMLKFFKIHLNKFLSIKYAYIIKTYIKI